MTTQLMPDEPPRVGPHNLDRILAYCESLKVSDITFQTGSAIYAEVYGRLTPITVRRLSNTEVGEILNTIYGPNGTAQILSGKDVDTHYEFRPSRIQRYRYRVNGTGCQVEGHDGIQLTLRSIPSTPPKLASLNLEPEILKAMAPHDGVVYVTGATGSGKSTLLASILRDLAERADGNRKMLTYESPIEFVFDSIDMPTSIVGQSEIPRHLPSFAAGVRNALRRKPMLIMVGEARDQETISAVLEAALTGHPVYTTLHTNGVAETIRRLVTSFPIGERHGRTIDILETARLIVWQKLVPTVDGKRVALREYLVFNEEIRDILLESPLESVTAITRRLLKERGQPMIVDAQQKFDAGMISERDYKLLVTLSKRSDRDAGV
ncbi:Dot/Icm type IV secretion system ATPase DotB [soil metagenome]